MKLNLNLLQKAELLDMLAKEFMSLDEAYETVRAVDYLVEYTTATELQRRVPVSVFNSFAAELAIQEAVVMVKGELINGLTWKKLVLAKRTNTPELCRPYIGAEIETNFYFRRTIGNQETGIEFSFKLPDGSMNPVSDRRIGFDVDRYWRNFEFARVEAERQARHTA